jgi:transcription initiation factor TFIID subunit TAF12
MQEHAIRQQQAQAQWQQNTQQGQVMQQIPVNPNAEKAGGSGSCEVPEVTRSEDEGVYT